MDLEILSKIKDFAITFEKNNKQIYLVGGCVRDILLGNEPKDFDFATDATPDEMKIMFTDWLGTGEKYGTMLISFKDDQYEVTTFRKDGTYGDGRRPDNVIFSKDIKDDLIRRDFTINAIAINAISGDLVDPHNGYCDLMNGLLRFPDAYKNSFQEDALRILRAIRFSLKYNFAPDENVMRYLSNRKVYNMLDNVSKERIHDELLKILSLNIDWNCSYATLAIEYLMSYLLGDVFKKAVECKQNLYHRYNVWKHCYETMKHIPSSLPLLRLAALFHDIKKPDVKTVDDNGGTHFYGHHVISADFAKDWMKEYKFSSSEIKYVSSLIYTHMFPIEKASSKAVRRLVQKNDISVKDWIKLHVADRKAGHSGILNFYTYEIKTRGKFFIHLYKGLNVIKKNNLNIDGNLIMKLLNIPPSPKVGFVLNILNEYVLEYPEKNKKEELVKIILSDFLKEKLKRS